MKDNGLLLCLDPSTPVGSIALTGEKGVIAAQTSANTITGLRPMASERGP